MSHMWDDQTFEYMVSKAWQGVIAGNPNGSEAAIAQRAIRLANALEEALEMEHAQRDAQADEEEEVNA